MPVFQWLDFKPFRGFSSKHLQTILPSLKFREKPPESFQWIIGMGDDDYLSCEVSQPKNWKPCDRTILLLHGLGGSHSGQYMIRIARKIFDKGMKVVRVNLRGCGSGKGLSKLPYHAGCSQDIFKVLQKCKQENPDSKLTVIGFSLGANIALKLIGELGESAKEWIETCFAICTPLDLKQTVNAIGKKSHYFYQRYFLKQLMIQAESWLKEKVKSIYEFDQRVTAPLWGFKDVEDYYVKCSSQFFLPKIGTPTHLLFAVDDPFIDLTTINQIDLPNAVKVWVTKHGGHMGFIGRNAKPDHYWMDQLLLNWLNGDFISNQIY